MRMHTRTSTVSDTVAHVYTQNHAQTNEQTCTNDARVHTHTNSMHAIRIQKYAEIHTHFTFTYQNLHIHLQQLTLTCTHTLQQCTLIYTHTCIHRHMGLHTKSIDRELVRPIHALRVLCHGTVKGKLFIRVAGT